MLTCEDETGRCDQSTVNFQQSLGDGRNGSSDVPLNVRCLSEMEMIEIANT